MEEVLRRVIPIEGDPPAAFETVGHIAHLNLRCVLEISNENDYSTYMSVFTYRIAAVSYILLAVLRN